MKWDKFEREYWDVGEAEIVTLSKANLSNIMMALVRCDGKISDSHCGDKVWSTSELRYKPHQCSLILRIELPRGAEEEFKEISGFTPTIPAQVGV